MTYVRSFAPWILYAALSSFDWRVRLCAAAVAAGLLAAASLVVRRPFTLSIGSSTPLIIVQVAGFVVPALFTKSYTARQRAAASARAVG